MIVHTVFWILRWRLVLLFTVAALHTHAQVSKEDQMKKNPDPLHLEIDTPRQDTSDLNQKKVQRTLPKFDLPEYVITGVDSIDLPKLEKILFEDIVGAPRTALKDHRKKQRERETREFALKNNLDESGSSSNKYSGLIGAGIGTYFTPQVKLWFGQTLPAFHYTIGGTYHLTKGYRKNTDQSGGSVTATGGTNLVSNLSMLRNAALNGVIGYQSESFRFYGSSTPDLQRTASGIRLQMELENQTVNYFPYSAGISVGSFNVLDSTVSKNETRLDLNMQTTLPVTVLPIKTKLHLMSASGGLGFLDLSGGFQDYSYAGILFGGSLHFFWAKGTAGQNIVRLRPNLTVSYQITSHHRIYVLYEPKVVPMTLEKNIQENQFLSAVSTIRHTDITNAGEIGIESDWNDAVRSRISFDVESVKDLASFSDSLRQGIWTATYDGEVTIVSISAEMFAKLNSNDYFASKIMLRSTKNSFTGKQIPYAPIIEAKCYASHRFIEEVTASAQVSFVGERKADLSGATTVAGYSVVDIGGEYSPIDFLRISLGVKNLTNARYETWRGYQEFPLTMHMAVQVKW